MFSGLMSRWTTPCSVGVGQRVRDLPGDAQRLVERQLRLAVEPVAQDSPSTNGMT